MHLTLLIVLIPKLNLIKPTYYIFTLDDCSMSALGVNREEALSTEEAEYEIFKTIKRIAAIGYSRCRVCRGLNIEFVPVEKKVSIYIVPEHSDVIMFQVMA